MTYEEWNNILAQHFFNEGMAGRQVLLYANESLINKLGGSEGSLSDFVAAIKQGPSSSSYSGLCQRALQACEKWSNRATSYPPYLAYLVLFVIAAVAEDNDFAPHAYYPRLWRLLQEDPIARPPSSFDRMIELWSDLEKWSREDRHEDIGRFVAWPRGSWIHVGMPLSQRILSEEERKLLPSIFYRAELDPTAPPAPEILIREIIIHGKNVLNRSTLKLLKSTSNDEKVLQNALADFVLEELSQWDGEVPDTEPQDPSNRVRVQAGLRICFKLNSFSRAAEFYLRLRAACPFPLGGLAFNAGTGGGIWTCSETHQGWSKPLDVAGTIPVIRVDAAALDWKKGVVLEDTENRWRGKLRPAQARLFMLGNYEGLFDWIETRRLLRDRDFIVICTEELLPNVQEWGRRSCDGFGPCELLGLPAGWTGFSGKGAKKSCPGIDVLSLSTTARLLLRGGIRIAKGNTYFDFAKPQIVAENFSSTPNVTVNGVALKMHADTDDSPFWTLPANVPLLTSLVIQADDSDDTLKKVIRLQPPEIVSSWERVPWRNREGSITALSGDEPRVQGALVCGRVDLPALPHQPHVPTYLSSRITFLGYLPGQIIEWPDEEISVDWQPTWALARIRRDRWQAHFCGSVERFFGVAIGPPLTDASLLKRWKMFVWNKRKQIEPPNLARAQRLWKEYVEAAKSV